MTQLPEKIETSEQLNAIISQPSEGLVEMMKRLDGDIMILGGGGKVGPTMSRTAKNAIEAAGVKKKVVVVDVAPLDALAKEGFETIKCDLMNLDEVAKLPKVKNVIYMVGRKFGSTGSEHLTWAINVIIPYHVARAFTGSRIVAFSTGCVYPVVHVMTGGSTEDDAANPIGEYAQSCLGRERMFDYYSQTAGEKVLHFRLNYAIDMRYGVLYDIASKIWAGEPVDVTTGYANVIWQGDACNQALQSLELASSPASVLNVTGPETFSIRAVAKQMAEIMGKEVSFTGEENGLGYLNNATKANMLFGNPAVSLGRLVNWTAYWVMQGGENLGKPTHFETQNGKY